MDHGESDTVWAPATRAADDPTVLLPGYRDFHLMARGGDSVVYRAHQDALDRDVAIKVVQLDDDESIARFRRELAITVRLGRQHPHIMTVLATGTTTSGQPCLVMDHFELGSLHDRLNERGPLPVSEVVAAGSVIADALSFAHTQGVLHRDVKPQNVLVLPTSWVLADFGLARAIDAGHSSSLERFSYRHASPQVLDGEPPTVADDLYSLGSTLFTLLDGRAPYAAEDPNEDSALSYLRRARTETPRAITRDDVPLQLAGIVRRCLARDPAQRFPDAAALRDALDAVPTETRSWAPDPAPQPVVDETPTPPPAPVNDDSFFAPPPASVEPPPTVATPTVATPTVATPLAAPIPTIPLPDLESDRKSDRKSDPVPRHAAPVPTPIPTPIQTPIPVPVPVPVSTAVEPDRPAVSALAQLPDHAAAPRDADATGLRPAEPPLTPPIRHEPAPANTRRWVVLGAIGAVALAGGIGIGVRRSGDDGTPAARTTATGGGTASASRSALPTGRSIPVVVPTGPVSKGILTRGKNPRILSFTRGEADSVVLRYTDPSKGTQTFVIFDADRPTLAPISSPLPRQTTTVLPSITSGRHCFAVGVVTATAPTLRVTVGPTSCKTV